MSTLYAMHGVVGHATPGHFSHRNLLDITEFGRFVRARPERFVSLTDALAGRGDALTIDDGTRAAADAALLARAAGHCVTLFVNPWNVLTGRRYPFLCLNVLLDHAPTSVAGPGGDRIDLSSGPARVRFRRMVKERLRGCRDHAEQEAVIDSVAAQFGEGMVPFPPHLETLGRGELDALWSEGVEIGNHGWMHVDPAALAPEHIHEPVIRGRVWLEEAYQCPAPFFAVPFGETCQEPSGAGPDTVLFLVHDALPAGRVAPGVHNRVNLEI